jgi:hypothetical protein
MIHFVIFVKRTIPVTALVNTSLKQTGKLEPLVVGHDMALLVFQHNDSSCMKGLQ